MEGGREREREREREGGRREGERETHKTLQSAHTYYMNTQYAYIYMYIGTTYCTQHKLYVSILYLCSSMP